MLVPCLLLTNQGRSSLSRRFSSLCSFCGSRCQKREVIIICFRNTVGRLGISQEGNPFDLSWLPTEELLVVLLEIHHFLMPLTDLGRSTLPHHHPRTPILRALYPRPHRQAGTPHILNGPRCPGAIKDNIHRRGRVIGSLCSFIPPEAAVSPASAIAGREIAAAETRVRAQSAHPDFGRRHAKIDFPLLRQHDK